MKQICADADGSRILLGTAYKSLDVTGIISRCRSRAELIEVLTEMDKNWKVTHDAAADIQRRFQEMKAAYTEIQAKASEAEQLNHCLQTDLQHEKQEKRALLEENRYLRKMLKTYLYPAIANQILLDEQVLSSTGTTVTQAAMSDLVDPAFPDAPQNITQSLSPDRQHKSEVRSILAAMWEDTD